VINLSIKDVGIIYENAMENCMKASIQTPEKAAIYTFMSKEPTMTNSRVEALGTGSHPPYVKIATSFKNANVIIQT
jgi:hypothetical protein